MTGTQMTGTASELDLPMRKRQYSPSRFLEFSRVESHTHGTRQYIITSATKQAHAGDY